MVYSLDRFVGKVAVVTGASAGIGEAIAEDLVKRGVIVAGLARRVERVEELAKLWKGQKGKLIAFKCDMTKEDDIISTFKQIVKKLGNISILVNNAGLAKINDLITGSTEEWKLTLDTNVLGLCIATREAIQNMKANGTKGHIIHINSLAGHKIMDFPGANVYGASKYAVTNLAETLRLDVNREKLQIKVTSVSPGYVKTDFTKAAGIPEGAITTPGLYAPDVSGAVVYALSTPIHVNINEISLQAVGSGQF